MTPTAASGRVSPPAPPSIFSKDIFLGDNSGESLAFARDVRISGWTNVGDKLGGAYIGALHSSVTHKLQRRLNLR